MIYSFIAWSNNLDFFRYKLFIMSNLICCVFGLIISDSKRARKEHAADLSSISNLTGHALWQSFANQEKQLKKTPKSKDSKKVTIMTANASATRSLFIVVPTVSKLVSGGCGWLCR